MVKEILISCWLLMPLTMTAQNNAIDRTRQTRVYYGMMSRFNETADAARYNQWSYTRGHVSGFYTNFIDVWQQKYQSGHTLQQMARLMAEAFPGKRLFYEGSMENQVNDSPNGRTDNAFETDVFHVYQDAGFTIDFGAINYMSNTESGTGGINDTRNSISECKEKIQHYYDDGVEKVLYLCGPWTSGSDLYGNNDARTMASWTDGVLSDGPIGYWVSDNGNYRQHSRNIVRYCREHGMTSALMICPYSVENSGGYSPYNGGFLETAKLHVFDQEDNNCMPDVWALWNYGGTEISNFQQFPESIVVDGSPQPQNTCTGVAYWLLYHLNECPVVKVANVPEGVSLHGKRNFSAHVAKGDTLSLTLTLRSPNKWVELSPVLNSLVLKNSEQWVFSYHLNGTDVTNDITEKGGFDCVKTYRISDGQPLTMTIMATPLEDNVDTELQIEAMSNAANTVNSKIISRIVLNGEYIPSPDDEPDNPDDNPDDDVDNFVPDDYMGTPWIGEPQHIPGRIECEWFDKGGKGVAWSWNNGPFAGGGREPGDGIEFIFGGMRLGWLTAFDENWAIYTVCVDEEADYRVLSSTATVKLEIDGYSSPKRTYFDSVHLRKGIHLLKVWYYAGTGDGDYLQFTKNETDVGVGSIEVNAITHPAIYSLGGVKIGRTHDGLYIINGKKVLIKNGN